MHQEHLEQLISTDFKLIALETDSPEKTINDFRPMVREGKAIYQWENDTGLCRMEASHIQIPKTKTPEMILNYIKQSKLYGIYLLVGFSKELNKQKIQTELNQIADDAESNKLIIFIDNHFNYPHQLTSKILIAQESEYRGSNSLQKIA